MKIRLAQKTDAPSIAPLLYLAMEQLIAKYIGEENRDKGIAFLSNFIAQEGNQYSYENCFVAETNGRLVGAACLYDGGRLNELSQPIIKWVRQNNNPDFSPGSETESGEWYLDSIGTNPKGLGTGAALLSFMIEKYVEQERKTLGLLVDFDNPHAQRLYERLGFELKGVKTFGDKQFNHLQISKFNS